MFETMFNRGVLPILEKAVAFHELRHRIIANNIANVETPLYKAKDLPVKEFQGLLRKAWRKSQERPVPIVEFKDSLRVRFNEKGSLFVATVASPDRDMMRHNQNNVSIDREMVKLARNTMMYNALVELVSSRYDSIASAIRERPA